MVKDEINGLFKRKKMLETKETKETDQNERKLIQIKKQRRSGIISNGGASIVHIVAVAMWMSAEVDHRGHSRVGSAGFVAKTTRWSLAFIVRLRTRGLGKLGRFLSSLKLYESRSINSNWIMLFGKIHQASRGQWKHFGIKYK